MCLFPRNNLPSINNKPKLSVVIPAIAFFCIPSFGIGSILYYLLKRDKNKKISQKTVIQNQENQEIEMQSINDQGTEFFYQPNEFNENNFKNYLRKNSNEE